MALTPKIIDEAVDRYWREYDRYYKLAEFIGDACRKLLSDKTIRGSVQWRPKNPDRFRQKLVKLMDSRENENMFTDVESVFRVLKDLAGVRITSYVETDREKLVSLVEKRFRGFGEDEAVGSVKKDSAKNYYRATHCLVRIKDEEGIGRYANLKGLVCEVQVCSMLAHVYNEIEHDLRYKPFTGELAQHEDGMLDILGEQMKTGDSVIQQILQTVAARQLASSAAFEDVHSFVVRMRPLFPNATDFSSNALQLFEACMELQLDTPEKIQQALNWTDTSAHAGFDLATRLAASIASSGTKLEVDPMSSDQLAVLLLQDTARVSQLREIYPSGRGVGRSLRLLSVAKKMEELPKP